MSALADALVAAQRRALNAMERWYVAGRLDAVEAAEFMESIGLTDSLEQTRLLLALDFIKDTGASVPSEPAANGAERPQEPATDAQRARIKRDVAKLHGDDAAAHIGGEPSLTKSQASEIIDGIKAGTFELEKWWVPF